MAAPSESNTRLANSFSRISSHTNAQQGLARENMLATLPAPCSQGYAGHETDEMRLHPAPLQCSRQHGIAKRDLKMHSYSTYPFSQSASNQELRLEEKQTHRRTCTPGQGRQVPQVVKKPAPSNVLGHSIVRNEPRLGTLPAKEDSRYFARQPAPLSHGFFLKSS